MRLGVFGGSFDPPHVGHLIVAQDAAEALGLDRVLFVPAAIPPHKRDRPVTDPGLRLEMVHAAIAEDPRFQAEELELRRAGPSYTVDTLRELKRREPAAELVLLLGVDQFVDFATWREPQEILRLAEVVVLSRGGEPVRGPAESLPHRALQVTRVDLSSTRIRGRVAAGEPIRYLVPESVERVIRREDLYISASRTERGSPAGPGQFSESVGR